jgi:hypothetical protein
VIIYGEHLESLGRSAARALDLHGADLSFQEEDRLAVGAARYAAMCLWQTLHGAPRPIHGLRVTAELSHDVGIICELNVTAEMAVATEGAVSALCWHRLFKRWQPVTEAEISLRLSGAAPASVLLAARGKTAAPRHTWLERGKWREHDLVWFAAADVETPADQPVTSLEIRLASPVDRLTRRWSDVTAEITPVT